MDASRFDAWTRRNFGLAAGGALAALLGLSAADAKKKGKKKRCRKLGATCNPGGKRKCCGKLRCDHHGINSVDQTFCCKTVGKSCKDGLDCCTPLECTGTPKQCMETPSDRALKANFGSVDGQDMLERVRDLPIATWNYTSDNPSVRHIGPMAQDFAATFGVGADDRHIHPIDGQGVALAAIQGLADELERLRAENAVLSARIAALEQARD
jgi:hypothetical protein